MKNLLRHLLVLGTAAFIAACSGGGGDSGDDPFGNGGDGDGGTGPSAVADLVLTLSATQIPNTGSATLAITVTAIDEARNTLSAVPVSVTADSDAIVTSGSTTTDASGNLGASLTIGANRSNRLITVTATSGSVTRTSTVQVVGTTISSTLVPAVIAPSTAGEVQYRVVDQAGAPMAGLAVQVTAPGLTPAEATGTTGANGDFVFTYTSGTATGNVDISFNAGGASDTRTLQVQTANTIPPVPAGTAIESASVSANPSVVAVNLSGSNANRSEIRALFLGANNQPIPNVRVRFDDNGDPNSIGGSFTTGDQILYSDANGIVTTAYVPGTRSSPTNGVTVRACYGKSETDPNLLNCSTFATQTLTVTAEPLGVSIGTNARIIVNTLTYVKQFDISVVDSAGNAMPDVNLVVSVDLQNYRKGFYDVEGDAWVKQGDPTDPADGGDSAICPNEDRNRNGVNESTYIRDGSGNITGVAAGSEDVNFNERLDPGKPDVAIKLLSPKTDANGRAIVQIEYAQSFGSWVDARITVAASGVSGTEGRTSTVLSPVPVDAASIKAVDTPPAYQTSPYGIVASCTDSN